MEASGRVHTHTALPKEPLVPIRYEAALEGGEWSASRPGRFTPMERAPGTHWIGG